ncbi:MAG: ABC transporter ATP-binding protein [Hyphomicrobiales bacterium]|nr:ABC transporter ATP-binding protein [Hyphomicrobiales bacterium]
MASLTLRRLTKKFGEMVAVDAMDLAIPNGEFLTLLGPSGCGKSTALACIAGLERPTSGEIVFDDSAVTDLEPHQRNVAMVFQDYALYPHMTVRENMSFGLRQQRLQAADITNQVSAAADMLGLANLLERRPAELSGGQRQRVALGRAVVRNPAVFLMDEPLSNLDAGLRIKTRTEIKKVQRELGVTSVFVTHDQEEAMVLSDRIAVMRDGRLQQIGPPMDVYRQPDNLFVAAFVGSPAMNFLDATLEADGDQMICRFAGQSVRLPQRAARGEITFRADGRTRVVMGVRPNDMAIGGNDDLIMTGKAFLVEPIGPISYVDIQISDTVIKATCEPDLAPAIDAAVSLSFKPERTLFFDRETEARI